MRVIHWITFEFYYKNDPENVRRVSALIPRETSSAARIYFWENAGVIISANGLNLEEVDNITIVNVRSDERPKSF